MMYPGIYSGIPYAEWKEERQKVQREQKKEALKNFVESIIDSAIFHSRKKYVPGCSLNVYGRFNARGIFKRIAEIIASVLFFVILVGGLNILALIM